MRIALLTTDTTHHTYYAWKLAEAFPLSAIVLETRVAQAPFETFHPFEAARDEYERDVLLAGFDSSIEELTVTYRVESANEAAGDLRALRPDIVLVFGTGKLLPEVYESVGTACLNLHGGNPEEYRGLDTHLWATYHRDFENLVTTLHHVDAELDTGAVVGRSRVPLAPGMSLHQLRARNTEVCLELSLAALGAVAAGAELARRPLTRRGRYYSFMPAVLKDGCVTKFRQHVEGL